MRFTYGGDGSDPRCQRSPLLACAAGCPCRPPALAASLATSQSSPPSTMPLLPPRRHRPHRVRWRQIGDLRTGGGHYTRPNAWPSAPRAATRPSRRPGAGVRKTLRNVHAMLLPVTRCVASVNGERTSAFNTRQKLRPCAAAGRAAARRAVLCARGVRSKHDAEAPRLVAARRSVEMIKLAGGAFRRLLEARLTYSSPKVSARRSCTNPRCPQLRSPHVHRERSSLKPHASRMQNVGFNFL